MSALEDCCYACRDCGRITCRDTDPTPGEELGLCEDCWDAECAEGRLRARDYEAWAAI